MTNIDAEKKEEIFMPTISEKTKQNIAKTIGISFDELVNLDFDDEIKLIESQNNKKISYNNKRISSRGNPRLATGRYCTMEDVDAKLKKIKNAR